MNQPAPNQLPQPPAAPADNQENIISLLACFPILFWLPLVTVPSSKLGRFYANYGLILLILSLLTGIVTGILGAIFSPLTIVGVVLDLGILALMVWGMVNAYRKATVSVPVMSRIVMIKYS